MPKNSTKKSGSKSHGGSSAQHAEIATVDAGEFSRAARNVRKTVKSKQAALRRLVDAGIFTKSGNLSARYK